MTKAIQVWNNIVVNKHSHRFNLQVNYSFENELEPYDDRKKKKGLIKAGCQTKKGAAQRRLEFCIAFLQTSELKIPPPPKASHYQEMKLPLPPAIGGEQHFEDALKCDRVRQLP